MKTIKKTFTALLIIAAVVLFGGFLAYSQDRPTPTPPLFPDCIQGPQHTCVGTCPVLWTGGQPPMPVQPYHNPGGSDCHKIQHNCSCEYRTSGGNSCTIPQGGNRCQGQCPDLYYDQNGTMPVPFAHKDCHTFRTGGTTECICIYY
jgi:hypothetical protein